jgi:hypothetical protein
MRGVKLAHPSASLVPPSFHGPFLLCSSLLYRLHILTTFAGKETDEEIVNAMHGSPLRIE